MRAVVYLRQSLDREGSGAAVDRQREDCLELCQKRHWKVVGEFVDNDTSASTGKRRPGYEAALEALDRGEAGVLVAYHADRVCRRVVDLEDLIARSQRGGWKFATVNGDLDLTNDSGRLLARILASVASAEVERKGARQSRAALQAAQRGRPAGGHRPFGYEPDGVTIRKDEARLVKLGYRRLLAGASIRSIVREWNDAGARTSRGGAWASTTVRRALQNPRYAGLRAYRGEVIGPAMWKQIVGEETWRAACGVLSDPTRRTTAGTTRRYLLAGLALCGLCGAKIKTGRTSHGKRTYMCSASKHLARAAEPIDAFVEAVVIARLEQPDAAELLVDRDLPDIDALRDEAQTLRARLDELAALFADGEVTSAQLAVGTEKLRKRLDEIEQETAHVDRGAVLGEIVRARDVCQLWERLDLDRRRAILDTLLTVTLKSPGRGARRFEPDTARIDWNIRNR